MPDNLIGKIEALAAKVGKEEEVPSNSSTSAYVKTLSFKAYMREINNEDYELMQRMLEAIVVPSGWHIENHMEDFYPGVWLRKDDLVVEVFAALGKMSARFGKYTIPAGATTPQEKSDLSMIAPIFPSEDIPFKIGEGSDIREDTKTFSTALRDYEEACVEWSNRRENGEDVEHRKDSHDEDKKDSGKQHASPDAKKETNMDIDKNRNQTTGSGSQSPTPLMPNAGEGNPETSPSSSIDVRTVDRW